MPPCYGIGGKFHKAPIYTLQKKVYPSLLSVAQKVKIRPFQPPALLRVSEFGSHAPIVCPPSMTRACPVTKEDSSDTRKSTP